MAYALRAEPDDGEIYFVYDELEVAYRQCKNNELNVIMGDFNSKVGNETSGKTIGPFGLGKRNERGDRFIQGLAVMNTWFDVHPRHRYTWVSPGDRARNQIDYILFSKRYRSAVSKVKTYPGADANSDHVPVVATVKLHFKTLKTLKQIPKFCINALKEENVHEQFCLAVMEGLDEFEPSASSETQ